VAVLPAFPKFAKESAVVGRLLAGYADLEIGLMHCVQVVRDDLDSVLKAMFRPRGNMARIEIADALGRRYYAKLSLEAEFGNVVSAIKYCLRIRNKYAHCVWYDDNSGELAFVNLEEIAGGNAVVKDLTSLTIQHADMSLVQAQFSYFEYTDSLTTWVNFEGQFRSGKLKQKMNPLGAAPAAVVQPALFK
jgi:hypothetical protein